MSNFIFEELRDRFPKVFGVPEYQRQPLAISIHEDIAAALGNYSAQEISEFLTYWTNSPFYLDNCRPGVDRVFLSGESGGSVTFEEARYAAKRKREVLGEGEI